MKTSIVIPYYDRPHILRKCLESIHDWTNTDKNPLEIIVVDDGSPDGGKASTKITREFGLTSHYRDKDSRNPGIPVNYGVKMATGEALLINDPDFIHASPVVGSMVARLNIKPGYYLACAYSLPEAAVKLRDFSEWERREAGIVAEGDDAWYCHPVHRNIGLGTVRGILREDFNRLGGMDTRYAKYYGYEDTDFLRTALNSNVHVEICPDQLVLHYWHYHGRDKEENESRRLAYIVNKNLYEEKWNA